MQKDAINPLVHLQVRVPHAAGRVKILNFANVNYQNHHCSDSFKNFLALRCP